MDRWKWIKRRLPAEPSRLLDAGCGNGWLTVNCARLGHATIGLGNDYDEVTRAQSRAAAIGSSSKFEQQDIRHLDSRHDLMGQFDVVTCTEVIEHVINDSKLVADLAALLRPRGKLLLTTPNEAYIPIDSGDTGPFEPIEDGRHVRKGYSVSRLHHLATTSGLRVDEISYCSGKASQRFTRLLRSVSHLIGYRPAWGLTLWLRVFPPVLDRMQHDYPQYSICMVASKL
ncbi:methyltransferase domain-containing protein [Acidiferrimicrobium sp. IK]|nr:methyltransferase domain-containing protein [Acidiferrimicrobium sp. IK]